MATTDLAALRNKQFLTPQEQAEASSQLRQDSLQKNDPINIGDYQPDTLEGQQVYNSMVSESSMSGFMRRAKQELKTRKQSNGIGAQSYQDGLTSKVNPGEAPSAQDNKKWGKSPSDMTGMMRSLKKQSSDIKEQSAAGKLEGKAVDVAAAPVSMATSKLLQQSWLNLIDSFGLTLIYINFHVFCSIVLGKKFFCKLGHEWMPKVAGPAGAAEGKAAASSGASLFGWGEDGVGLLEIMALILLDLLVLILIFVAVFPYFLLAFAQNDSVGFLSLFGMQDLLDLFTK